ncbi:MAG: RNA polymerase sigma factor [Deltaproteobacteria bacterium]|nr:MAG: RNA polymerase sigma factor [Deltaproteobacteria bacterium]
MWGASLSGGQTRTRRSLATSTRGSTSSPWALCGDRDLAADLTQDALVRGYLSFDRSRPGAPVYPWLARILRNAFIDHRRSARVRREVAADAAPEPTAATPAPEDQVIAGERADALYAALAASPPEQSLAVTLVDLQGLDNKDAAAMDVPVGTVRSRRSGGRAALRDALVARGVVGR